MRYRSFTRLHEMPTSGRLALSSLKFFLILAIAVGAGCGGSTGGPSLGHPEWSQEPPASTVSQLHFGTVPVGSHVKLTATLTNSGSADFAVDSMSIEGSTSFRIDFEPFAVRPGDSTEIPITFEPGSAGPHAGRLVVKLGNADVPEIGLDIEGFGVAISCEIEPPDTLDFGLVAASTSSLKKVNITNPSGLDWYVRIAPIAEDGEASFHFAEFEAGEHTIPANGKLAIPIEFRPVRTGLHEAVLEVLAPCQHRVALVGQGHD